VAWELGVDGQVMEITYFYASQLQNPSQNPAVAQAGLTPADCAQILACDPFASVNQAIDPNRFVPLSTTFPYKPPLTPGDTPPTMGYVRAGDTTVTHTTQTQVQYGVTASVSGSIEDFLKLNVSDSLQWTNTSTSTQTTDSSQTASTAIGGPAFGYTGPTELYIYWDTVFRSFMFSFDGPTPPPVKDGGPPPPANNYETVGLFLMQNGYSAVGAAGICGCIAGESGGDPEAVQFPSDPESGGAGLIQWTPASSMKQYGGTCAAAGIGTYSVAVDMQNQMNAILGYNNAQGSSNVAELNAQPDPITAANFYSQVFERPVVKDSDVRPAVAQSVYAYLTGQSTPLSPSPVPGQEYAIQAGDTLNSIAAAAYGAANAGAGVTAIENANPGIVPEDLQIGQEIMIPVLGGTGPPVPGP
jgi:phage tail protein X